MGWGPHDLPMSYCTSLLYCCPLDIPFGCQSHSAANSNTLFLPIFMITIRPSVIYFMFNCQYIISCTMYVLVVYLKAIFVFQKLLITCHFHEEMSSGSWRINCLVMFTIHESVCVCVCVCVCVRERDRDRDRECVHPGVLSTRLIMIIITPTPNTLTHTVLIQ